MPVFDFKPSFSSGGNFEFATNEVNYGDGYTQRSAASINNRPLTFSLVFARRTALELSRIESFLAALGGVTSFDWKPPSPHNYEDAPTFSGGHSKGEQINDGSGNVFASLIDSNSNSLTDPTSWAFLARVPLQFVCPKGSWSYDQHNSNTLNVPFVQVFA